MGPCTVCFVFVWYSNICTHIYFLLENCIFFFRKTKKLLYGYSLLVWTHIAISMALTHAADFPGLCASQSSQWSFHDAGGKGTLVPSNSQKCNFWDTTRAHVQHWGLLLQPFSNTAHPCDPLPPSSSTALLYIHVTLLQHYLPSQLLTLSFNIVQLYTPCNIFPKMLTLHPLLPSSNSVHLWTPCSPLPKLFTITSLTTCSITAHLCMPCYPLPMLLTISSPANQFQRCSPLHPLQPSTNDDRLCIPCHPLPVLLT